MFGKLTLEKIEKYLFENSGATLFIHQNRNPIEAVLLLDNAWAGSIFQKYKVWLNHEQKWYLFLSLCERFFIHPLFGVSFVDSVLAQAPVILQQQQEDPQRLFSLLTLTFLKLKPKARQMLCELVRCSVHD